MRRRRPTRISIGRRRAWITRLGRFGLACRGVVYLVMAVLAVDLAAGRGGQADQRGALQAIAHHRFGHLLVLLMAVGFASLALWQAMWAARASGPRATTSHRLVAAGKAAVYLALSASALAISLGRSTGTTSDTKTVDVTARVMRHSLGRPLVAAVGLIVAAVGLRMIYKAVHRRFDVEVRIDDVPRSVRHAFEALGVAGMTARGVIVGLIGYFVIQAAVTFDPGRAKGLDGVLSSVIHDSYGPLLLFGLAIGLACFGCFSLVESRYARD